MKSFQEIHSKVKTKEALRWGTLQDGCFCSLQSTCHESSYHEQWEKEGAASVRKGEVKLSSVDDRIFLAGNPTTKIIQFSENIIKKDKIAHLGQ